MEHEVIPSYLTKGRDKARNDITDSTFAGLATIILIPRTKESICFILPQKKGVQPVKDSVESSSSCICEHFSKLASNTVQGIQ
jgi:hypothetical protein